MSQSDEGRILQGEEAANEIARQFRELETRDKQPSKHFNFIEESEGEKEINLLLDAKKEGIKKRNNSIKLRALANEQLFEILECARWSREREFAFAISVLKDDAKDTAVRQKAQKAFDYIYSAFKKYKIDDDRLMQDISDIMINWERQTKIPWDIRDEVLRDQYLNINGALQVKYQFGE